MCIFKSITASSLVHPNLPFENQVPCVQNETVELQTNLMNNPAELQFKLDYSDCWMYGDKLEFNLKRVLGLRIIHTHSPQLLDRAVAMNEDTEVIQPITSTFMKVIMFCSN